MGDSRRRVPFRRETSHAGEKLLPLEQIEAIRTAIKANAAWAMPDDVPMKVRLYEIIENLALGPGIPSWFRAT